MSWLTKRYDPTNPNADADGMVAIKKTTRGKPDQLFPDDWKQHKSSVDNSNYWDVINNPLYEAAALANGINWDQWVVESFEDIGDEATYGSNEYVRVETRRAHTKRWKDGSTEVPATYKVMTRREAYEKGYTDRDIAAGSGEAVDQPDSDLKNWGIHRGEFGAVAEDLDTMHEWLTKTIKTHSLQDAPIIDRGPRGSDYGIDGDIWEHYGLDKPPEPPKTMDIHYDFNLLDVKPSTAYYSTPHGYPELDLSTESVPYGATAYAEFMGDKGMDVPLTHQKVVEGYQHHLDRDPSRDESLNWQSHSEDEKFFTDSLPNDPLVHEVKDSVLNKAYKARFGRLPSDAERTNWKGTGKSLDEIKEGIANHPDLEEQSV